MVCRSLPHRTRTAEDRTKQAAPVEAKAFSSGVVALTYQAAAQEA